MDRICDPFAYGSGPVESCFWPETTRALSYQSLTRNLLADVTIIGSGFTGLSAALRLASAGLKVVVLDAKQPGWGASGRNGGFCCMGGSKLPEKALVSRFGDADALDYRLAERDAVDFVDHLISSLGFDVDRHSNGEVVLAHRKKDLPVLEHEAQGFRRTFGVEPRMMTQECLAQEGMSGPFYGGLSIPVGFALNPLKYGLQLAEAAENAGAMLFGESPVTNVQQTRKGFVVSTSQANVRSRKVILATNGYASENIPSWMSGRYIPAQSSVIVTRPLTEQERAAQGWHSSQMAYDTRNLLHYFRLMPDGRFLFGMRGGLSTGPKVHKKIRNTVRREFDRMFSEWKDVETPYFWSGFVCFNAKLLPFAGEIPTAPGLYAAFAYHGNGVAMGSYCGALVADKILGRRQLRYPRAIEQPPPKFPGGRFRRLGMWPAYLLYALSDL
ncbi:FAD-dependent oxidoreductase [Shimia sp. SDUM112013]|uniref:NAD(P)/FAD-dependent oxidoreductase n=1 Tax=Shimia sp. SDUM112013 TaxID=3136160 RepID=UPI0032EEEAF7